MTTKKKDDVFELAAETESAKPQITWIEHPHKKGLFVINLSPSIAASIDVERLRKVTVIDFGSGTAKGIRAEVREDGSIIIACCILYSNLKQILQKNLVENTGFFAVEEDDDDAELVFTTFNENGEPATYAFGERASDLGGALELKESKTVGMIPRTIGALIGMGIVSGDIFLGALIIFNNGSQWKTDESQANHLLGRKLQFSFAEKDGLVNVLPDELLVAPEDFHAEQFAWKVAYDRKGVKYPCWKGLARIIIGLGFRTTNITVISKTNRFDPYRSRSINLGTNYLYKKCAELFGGNSSPFDSGFRDKINQILDLDPADYPVGKAYVTIPTVGIQLPFETVLKNCQTAKNNYLSKLFSLLELDKNENIGSEDPDSISVLFSSVTRFMITGGGATPCGSDLTQKLDKYESFICPFPVGAAAAGLFFAMAERKNG
jgi:hypothetical protein